MKNYLTIAKDVAVVGSVLMLTARFMCVGGLIAATTYFCHVVN